jgi:hypothetical protein
MASNYSTKDRETINLFLIATKGVLDDFRALIILMSLVAQYDVIKNQFSSDIAKIIVEAKSINSYEPKEVTLSKVQNMYDSLKKLEIQA